MARTVLSRILAMPWSEVMGRTRQELRKLQDQALPPGPRFRTTLEPRTGGVVPRALVGLADPAATVAWCAAHDPERCDERVLQADRMLDGEVPLLGWGWMDVGSPPDWLRDPVTGRPSPDLPWSRIDFLDPGEVGDSKAVWELSRHQYLLVVAQAYQLTGEDRYRAHVWRAIGDWIDRNPLGHGINWSSSLEVALRAVSWSWIWHLADGRHAMDESAASVFLRCLEWHGLHLERYLSTWFSPNTHLTGEALGLCALASFWPEAAPADRWWRTGAAILDRELERQVGRDGFHMERSTCYHRYTVDFYLHYWLLCRSRGHRPAPGFVERFEAMVDALACFRRPDGRLVAVGDEDGGRFLPLDGVDPLDPGATLLLARAALGREGGPRESGSARWEVAWILGPEAALAACGERPDRVAAPSVSLLSDAGFAAVRADGALALVSAGIQRGGSDCTGHVHDDAMSVELWLDGAPVFVDPGTFSYTGDLERRAWYRGGQAHNCVLPAHHVGPSRDQPFGWGELRKARFGPAGVGTGFAYVTVRCPLAGGLVHDRLVVWREERGWLIWDRVRGPSQATLTTRFQLAAASPVGEWQGGAVALGRNRILLCGPLARGGTGHLIPSDLSPLYGQIVSAAAWEARASHALPVDGLTLVRPASDSTGIVRSRGGCREGRLHRAVWVGGRNGERIGLSESIGTDIAESPASEPVLVRWAGPGLRPLELSLGAVAAGSPGGTGDPANDPPGAQIWKADDS